MTTPKLTEAEQQAVAALAKRIRKAAVDLRRLADQLDRRADQVAAVGGIRQPSYINVVATIQGDVRNAMFVACLDELIYAAAEADRLRTERLMAGTFAGQYAAKGA